MRCGVGSFWKEAYRNQRATLLRGFISFEYTAMAIGADPFMPSYNVCGLLCTPLSSWQHKDQSGFRPWGTCFLLSKVGRQLPHLRTLKVIWHPWRLGCFLKKFSGVLPLLLNFYLGRSLPAHWSCNESNWGEIWGNTHILETALQFFKYSCLKTKQNKTATYNLFFLFY